MAIYADTPVGAMRDGFIKGAFGRLADAGKSVAAMIHAMDADRPPLRLTLGSNAYH